VTDSDPRRTLLLDLLQSALSAVGGRRTTCVALRERASSWAGSDPVWVIAVGKAAAAQALGAHDAFGSRIARVLLITKDGHTDAEARKLPHLTLIEAAHPVPDARSLQAGAALVEWVADVPRAARLVFLISGGASSLAEHLNPGVTLAELQRLNHEGLASGADIASLNARRRQISNLKGGQLAARLRGREALALFISDVPGDDPAVIGSGLMGAAPGGDHVERVVVASVTGAMQAVAERVSAVNALLAHRAPTQPALTIAEGLQRFNADAERLAVRFVHELHFSRAPLHVWGGESTVRLPAHPGRGGRNQHLALAAAKTLAGEEKLFLLAVGTDGTDGATDDAGAIVDGDTCGRIAAAGLDVDDCLRRADSAPALAAAGDLVHTGPTGTNVGDLVLGLKLGKDSALAWLNARSRP